MLDRVSQLFDEYRKKVTGSLDNKRDERLFDFVYKYRSTYQTEILDYFYRKGFEDGMKSIK
jgi:hypothetical protein